MNPQAEELNNVIKKNNPSIYEMLSKKGKAAFFPKKGIISQTGQAKGKEINASIGMALEDNGQPMVLNGLKKLIVSDNAASAFSYANSYGSPELRKIWKEKILAKNPGLNSAEISSPVISNALTHGLSMCGFLFIDDNDSIICPDLYWGNYRLIFSSGYGADIETYTTFNDEGYNIEGLKQSLLNHEKEKLVVILNFPNNPTGYTPTISEMDSIKETLLEAGKSGKKLVVLCDDAYFGLVYEDGVVTTSPFHQLANIHENILAVKVDGATKEDYVWGFRVGFITYGVKGADSETYSALEAKTAGAIRGSISNAPNISQFLLSIVYKDSAYDEEKDEKYETLKKRYLKIKTILKEHPEYGEYFTPLPFNSGYFMCIELINLEAENVRTLLLDKYSVGLIALGKILRIAFSATPIGKLEKLFNSVYSACKDLS